jgi:hypothetical protein
VFVLIKTGGEQKVLKFIVSPPFSALSRMFKEQKKEFQTKR